MNNRLLSSTSLCIAALVLAACGGGGGGSSTSSGAGDGKNGTRQPATATSEPIATIPCGEMVETITGVVTALNQTPNGEPYFTVQGQVRNHAAVSTFEARYRYDAKGVYSPSGRVATLTVGSKVKFGASVECETRDIRGPITRLVVSDTSLTNLSGTVTATTDKGFSLTTNDVGGSAKTVNISIADGATLYFGNGKRPLIIGEPLEVQATVDRWQGTYTASGLFFLKPQSEAACIQSVTTIVPMTGVVTEIYPMTGTVKAFKIQPGSVSLFDDPSVSEQVPFLVNDPAKNIVDPSGAAATLAVGKRATVNGWLTCNESSAFAGSVVVSPIKDENEL